MRTIYQKINQIKSFAFDINPKATSWFKSEEDAITKKGNLTSYIKFQYSLTVISNILIALPSLIYIFQKLLMNPQYLTLSSIMFIILNAMMLIECMTKIMIIKKTISLSLNRGGGISINDFTKSNIMYYNTKLSKAIVVFYFVFYSLFYRSDQNQEEDKQYNYIISLLIKCFLFNTVVSFLSYLILFWYQNNKQRYKMSGLHRYHQIQSIKLTKENMNKYIEMNEQNDDDEEEELCIICMKAFALDDVIKVLPCNKNHVFHKSCIDQWVKVKKICPKCKKYI